MRYSLWDSVKSVEYEYFKSLMKIVKIFNRIANECKDDEVKYSDVMNKFQNTKQYDKYIYSIVKRMVTPLSVKNEATWRKAAKKSNLSPKLYKILLRELKDNSAFDDIIKNNAKLIKTLPNDVANKVVNVVRRETLKGTRASTIEQIILKKTKEYARASAKLIARTEVSKTQSAITQVRSKRIGINWYVWRTERDGLRVRKSHRRMEGVLVNWNDPPSPEKLIGEKDVGKYHAGNIWNCRCYSAPLLEIDDVKWPHEVYMNGKIKKMNRKEFEKYV